MDKYNALDENLKADREERAAIKTTLDEFYAWAKENPDTPTIVVPPVVTPPAPEGQQEGQQAEGEGQQQQQQQQQEPPPKRSLWSRVW